MADPVRLNSLFERVADATAPECSLLAEVFFACVGKQLPDIKAHFVMLLDDKAWTDSALVLAVYALPGWRVVIQSNRRCGEALFLAPNSDGSPSTTARGEPVRHKGGEALALLMAVITELGTKRPSPPTR